MGMLRLNQIDNTTHTITVAILLSGERLAWLRRTGLYCGERTVNKDEVSTMSHQTGMLKLFFDKTILIHLKNCPHISC